ncbi:PREDICTED: decorin-like, partial [Mesitornis unicolor]|uniref:decorin-like n=1 Tax=Mesitornis unicolor TaxID=54374 RepID=UPI000528F574
MRLAFLFVLLLPACLAKPFHQQGLFDFMLEDEGSADMPPTDDPGISGFGPVCPFRCQCHLRVVQCSDL